MVTNIDARTNARNHYTHHIIKYKFHDVGDADGTGPVVVSNPGFEQMAQSHKNSTTQRWLQDYLGFGLYKSIPS